MSEEAARVDGESQPPAEAPAEEEPVVAPEDMPKCTLEILHLAHQAQSSHGLRRTVPDYERYRT